MTLFKVNNGASLKIANASINVPSITEIPPDATFYVLDSAYEVKSEYIALTPAYIFGPAGAGSTLYARRNNSFYGASTAVVALSGAIKSIFGTTGVPADAGGSNGTGDWGALYINGSSSAGVEEELIVGPTWPANSDPTPGQPSNYYSIDDLFGAGSLENAAFLGKSVASVSSSQGVYLASSAPGLSIGGNSNAGAVFLIQSNSSGLTGVHKFTGSAVDAKIGAADATQQLSYAIPSEGVSLDSDDAGNIYVSYYDNDSNTVQVNKSSSAGGIEFISAFAPASSVTDPDCGISHEMKIAGDGSTIYVICGNMGTYDSNKGRAILYTYNVSGDSLFRTFIQPDSVSANDYFAKCSPAMSIGTAGIHIALRKLPTAPASSPLGSVAYLFYSNSSGVTQQSAFTGSGAQATESAYLGSVMRIGSSSNTPPIVAVNEIHDLDNSSGEQSGRIWIYETGSTDSNVFYIDESYRAAASFDMQKRDETVYFASGDDANTGNQGKGYSYKWNLTVSGS